VPGHLGCGAGGLGALGGVEALVGGVAGEALVAAVVVALPVGLEQ